MKNDRIDIQDDIPYSSSHMKLILLTIVLFFSTAPVWASDIKPFTSDGCSVFPDGVFDYRALWLSCCIEHDRAYWKGGTYKQRIDADLALRKCVNEVGQPVIANLMLAGVRVGGSPFIPSKFRWGYGWPFPSGYKTLTTEQLKKIEQIKSKQTQQKK